MEKAHEAFNVQGSKQDFYEKNPFKKRKTKGRANVQHEGFNKRTIIVDYYKGKSDKANTTIYSSHRVVQSQASQSKMQLIEV